MQLSPMRFAVGGALAASLALAGCVPPAPEPTPAPSPTPTPPAAEAAAPASAPASVASATLGAPPYANWHDAPLAPGSWSYARDPGETLALFGDAAPDHLAVIRCDLATKRIGIARRSAEDGQRDMRLTTETQTRLLTAGPVPGRGLVASQLHARDALLDAIAFSKGRFLLELAGEQPIAIPARPAITRVIEDCRS